MFLYFFFFEQELSALYREMPSACESEGVAAEVAGAVNGRQIAMQAFVEEFVNLCSFHMWMGLLG